MLRPALGDQETHPLALPFYQAVPMPAGKLPDAPHFTASIAGKPLSAVIKPLSYWPDGSVRWLGVNGLWPAGQSSVPTPLQIIEGKPEPASPPKLILQENENRNGLVLLDGDGATIATFTPFATALPITLPKKAHPVDADYLDREGQYSWAQRFENLNPDPQPLKLQPRIVSSSVEESHPLYDVQVFRGNCGDSVPGRDLEWQLRAKIYRNTPIVQTQMTWIVRWPVEKFALASAGWKIVSPQAWKEFRLADPDSPASAQTLEIRSAANGTNVLLEDETSSMLEDPAPSRNGILAVGENRSLAVGIVNFTRLGPNHIRGHENTIEIAMWSDTGRLALDLRRSSDKEDYGIAPSDLKSNGRGFSQTLRATLAFFESPEESATVARHAMFRQDLWLPDASDLERTKALGPFSQATIRNNEEYFLGLRANLLFLVRARNHWKWNGLANFGDHRTNFAQGDNAERGLSKARWALNGRYGWRNGSGDIAAPLLTSGLFLNDREIALAGIEQAEHVGDVDIFHGSLFAPETGLEGGIHRRNRDHWSGLPQMQYSPSEGLYLAQWLTGDGRLRDALKGLREFAKNDGGRTSPFAAQAWIMRYMETHAESDLRTAEKLLHTAAEFWKEEAVGTPLTGVARFFVRHTIRRIDNGMVTLRLFYEATGEDTYLQAIRDSLVYHKFDFPPTISPTLDVQGMLGYVLAEGMTFSAAEEPFLQKAAAATQQFMPSGLPRDPSALPYAALVDIVTTQLPPFSNPAYREAAAIGLRARSAFLALQFFGAGSPFLPEKTAKEGIPQL